MFRVEVKQVIPGVIGLIVAFFLVQRALWHTPGVLENIASVITYPVLKIQYNLVDKIQYMRQNRQTITQYQKIVELLCAEKQDLLARTIELEATLKFAQDIQEVVEFKNQYHENSLMLGHVILKHISPQDHFFLIDRGSVHGISENMVALYKNCLLGRVHQVYPYYSKVVLVTDKTCKVAAWSVNSKVHGICQGINDPAQLSLCYISHLHTLAQGDLVLSSGQGAVFPQGFALGKIKSFQADNLYYQIVLEPLIDIKSVNYCYLAQKGESGKRPLTSSTEPKLESTERA